MLIGELFGNVGCWCNDGLPMDDNNDSRTWVVFWPASWALYQTSKLLAAANGSNSKIMANDCLLCFRLMIQINNLWSKWARDEEKTLRSN